MRKENKMLNVLVFVLVIVLLIADSFIFFLLGFCFNGKKIVEGLKEKGWKVEPPSVEDVLK